MASGDYAGNNHVAITESGQRTEGTPCDSAQARALALLNSEHDAKVRDPSELELELDDHRGRVH